jgi:hypothetical protein
MAVGTGEDGEWEAGGREDGRRAGGPGCGDGLGWQGMRRQGGEDAR